MNGKIHEGIYIALTVQESSNYEQLRNSLNLRVWYHV